MVLSLQVQSCTVADLPVGAIMAISNHAISMRGFDLVFTNLLQKTARKKLISIGEFVIIGQLVSIRSVRI